MPPLKRTYRSTRRRVQSHLDEHEDAGTGREFTGSAQLSNEDERAEPSASDDRDENVRNASIPAASSQNLRDRSITIDDRNDDNAQRVGSTLDDFNTQTLISRMIRYCLACELRREYIRREDLLKTVIGSEQRRLLPAVDAGARRELRRVFGFELVPVPEISAAMWSASKRHRHFKATGVSSGTLSGRKRQKTADDAGSGQQNSLDDQDAPNIIQLSTNSGKTPSRMILVDAVNSELKREARKRFTVPRDRDEAAYCGKVMLICAIIALHGGLLAKDLFKQLHKTGFQQDPECSENQALIARMCKHHYLLTVKSEGQDTCYAIGPRSIAEIGKKNLADFVAFFLEPEDFPSEISSVERFLQIEPFHNDIS